jgi:hydrogenase nickel insertion protein HypA
LTTGLWDKKEQSLMKVEHTMCLAVPSKVISVNNGTALIDVFGARKEVSLKLLSETPKVGDFVLVHAGFAIQKVSADQVHAGEFMHESSLAINMIDFAQEQCHANGGASVESITVRLGAASGIKPESLEQSFNALKSDTIASSAKVVFELIPASGTCAACGKPFEFNEIPDLSALACPHCGSQKLIIIRGREMEIVSMELNS